MTPSLVAAITRVRSILPLGGSESKLKIEVLAAARSETPPLNFILLAPGSENDASHATEVRISKYARAGSRRSVTLTSSVTTGADRDAHP